MRATVKQGNSLFINDRIRLSGLESGSGSLTLMDHPEMIVLKMDRSEIRVWFMVGILAGLMAYGVAAAGQPVDVKALAAAVDTHYNHLKSLEAEFTEVYRGAGMERTESGTLWLKKPGKMRWEYRSPREKLFVSDGKAAWFYVPDDRQARKTDPKKLEDLRSPLALLLGKTKLEKELRGLSLAVDITPLHAGDVVLRGVPRGLEDRISEILLEITEDHRIARIVIQDVDGSATEYQFTDQKEDVAVADGRFAFTPPAGTETVEELGP
jgi:outer membrane lipoprotein carrier protein